MAAVDGGNSVLEIGSGNHCFVLAVRYSTQPGYDIALSMERLRFEDNEPGALMYGVRPQWSCAKSPWATDTDSFR